MNSPLELVLEVLGELFVDVLPSDYSQWLGKFLGIVFLAAGIGVALLTDLFLVAGVLAGLGVFFLLMERVRTWV